MEGQALSALAKPTRVAVIGAGLTGSTYAYTLLLLGLADEICLIDARAEEARGEAMGLSHAAPMAHPASIWAGTMDDLSQADLIMISAGISERPGQTQMELLRETARVVGDIAEEAGAIAPKAVFLVATDPADVMSFVTMKRSKVLPSRVLGPGTAVGTARLRSIIGSGLGVDPTSVHAFVLGEGGNSELVAWSRAQVAGTEMSSWPQMDEDRRRAVAAGVKGAACYATALARITEAVLKDSRAVLSVSAYLQGEYGIYDVYLGVPAVVGRGGALRTLEIPLSKEELARFQESARTVRTAAGSLDLGRRELVAAGARGFETSKELEPGTPVPRAPGRARTRPVTKRPRPLT